jgi:hypothetical protein
MLIYGMFNASISGEQMSKMYAYNGESESWYVLLYHELLMFLILTV